MKATVILQVLLGPSVAPHPLFKTKLVASVSEMLVMVSENELVLLKVTVHALPVTPTGSLEKAMLVGDTRTVGRLEVPVPLSVMVWVVNGVALSVITTLAVKSPTDCGLKATCRLQVLLAGRMGPQPVLMSWKSVVSFRRMLAMFSGNALVLLTVTVVVFPVLPTG